MVPALAVRDLRFSYRAEDGDFVLAVHELEVEPGGELLITGSSGVGKSTLLHLIAGLLDADAGSVAVAGRDIQALRGPARDALRGRQIGMIFQTFHLLPGMSAIENVELALLFGTMPPAEHRARALELLEKLGITHPRRPVEKLSVGQQQRVAIARAVACRPALVLADEPTASLDPQNTEQAMELMQSACREVNAALVCVSHDVSIASRFARRVTMGDLARGVGVGAGVGVGVPTHAGGASSR